MPGLGRYSILTADPLQRWSLDAPRYGLDPFAPFRSVLDPWQSESLPAELSQMIKIIEKHRIGHKSS